MLNEVQGSGPSEQEADWSQLHPPWLINPLSSVDEEGSEEESRALKGPEEQNNKLPSDANTLKNNIMVKIFRKIPQNGVSSLQRAIVNPSTVTPFRRPGEGKRPIFERKELVSGFGGPTAWEEATASTSGSVAEMKEKSPESKSRRSRSRSGSRSRSERRRRSHSLEPSSSRRRDWDRSHSPQSDYSRRKDDRRHRSDHRTSGGKYVKRHSSSSPESSRDRSRSPDRKQKRRSNSPSSSRVRSRSYDQKRRHMRASSYDHRQRHMASRSYKQRQRHSRSRSHEHRRSHSRSRSHEYRQHHSRSRSFEHRQSHTRSRSHDHRRRHTKSRSRSPRGRRSTHAYDNCTDRIISARFIQDRDHLKALRRKDKEYDDKKLKEEADKRLKDKLMRKKQREEWAKEGGMKGGRAVLPWIRAQRFSRPPMMPAVPFFHPNFGMFRRPFMPFPHHHQGFRPPQY